MAFGQPLEWLGAAPAEFHSGAARALGPAAARVAAVLFTHLHTDHVEGVLALCAARGGAALALPQTPAQAKLVNHTTRPGRRLLERAGCLAPRRLAEAPLAPGRASAGVARGRRRRPHARQPGGARRGARWRGAAAPRLHGRRGEPRRRDPARRGEAAGLPLARRPGVRERLGRVRRWLRHLEQDLGFELVVAHDQAQLDGARGSRRSLRFASPEAVDYPPPPWSAGPSSCAPSSRCSSSWAPGSRPLRAPRSRAAICASSPPCFSRSTSAST